MKYIRYKCLNCKHTFESGEEAKVKEIIDVIDGFTYYEEFSVCPVCRNDYEKLVECDGCGQEFGESELTGGLCEKCLDEESV